MSSKTKDLLKNKPLAAEENKLTSRARKGDADAFGCLVELFQDRVYNFSYRLTGGDREKAWDLSQEAFCRAYAAIRGFKGESGFYTWIYRIVLNLHMNMEKSMRSRKEKRSVSLDHPLNRSGRGTMADELPDRQGSDPSEEAVRNEREAAVQKAISLLAWDQRQAVLLRDMEGMSYEEIAGLLSVPVGTVRSRLHRAREGLKNLLEGVF